MRRIALVSLYAAWTVACLEEPTLVERIEDADVCNRTPQVRDEIVRKAGVTSCSSVDARRLAAIWWLDLAGAGLTSVQEGDFDGLTGITRLDLGQNSLTSLPEGVFSDLAGLRELFLHFNALTTLPANVFDGLGNLEWLTLHENDLNALPPQVFAGLSRLKRLSLISNDISAMPETLFEELHNLEYLHLGSSGIAAVPEGLFRGLSRLETLAILGNNLRSLPPGVFAGLGSLETLDLRYNLFQTLPEHLFVDLVALKTLRLGYNNLRSLPEWLLSGPRQLESLNLGHNPLETLPDGVFAELDSLRWLDLSSNRLSGLPEEVFGGLTALRTLKLEDNRIHKLSSGLFADLSNLEILSLADNDLQELPAGIFAGLESAKRLTLHGNPGAPFTLVLRVKRTDNDNLLAPSPGKVVLHIDEGAPFDMTVNVSAQGGALSAEQVTLEAGATSSRKFEVTSSTGTATHVSAGPPPLVSGEFTGIGIDVGDPVVLFAEASNHAPVAAKTIPPYRLRAGGRAGEVDLSFPWFEDPDGDSLTYEVVSDNPEVTGTGLSGGIATFRGVAEGTALVTIRATDPEGLSAEQSVHMHVIAPGDPKGFNIDLVAVGDVPSHVMHRVGQAAERWRRIVAQTVLPTTAVLADDDLECFGARPGFRMAEIEDLLVLATVTQDDNSAFMAGPCRTRDGSLLPLVAVVKFNEASLAQLEGDGRLPEVAVHLIGHTLGIGTIWDGLGLLRNPSRRGNRGADTHFTGPLATAAFDAAGGAAYADGAKVPVENGFSDFVNDSHWRTSVMQNEIMTPFACVQPGASPLSAITIQTLADFGYTVDVSLADPYTLPLPATAIAEPAADPIVGLGNDVPRGPVLVINEQGEAVRVLRN